MIAPAYLPLICGTCTTLIRPGESYVVTPDVAGVGADVIACLHCGPDEERLACSVCSEAFDVDDDATHDACVQDRAHCSNCGDCLTDEELAKVRCGKCGDAKTVGQGAPAE